MPLSKEDLYRHAGELLRSARHAVVFTGAGISTPSGIPDFRSQGSGLWTRDDPMQVASLTAFRHRPERFFNWLRPLAASIHAAQPNPAHHALAELEQAGLVKAIITQNIDGLHQRSGSRRVLEVHGGLTTLSCPRCRRIFPSEPFWSPFVEEGSIPRCPVDGQNLKPDIVLFEEMLPVETWQAAEAECLAADLMLVVGSSLEVSPANMLPVYALQNGARLAINTRSATFLDGEAEILLPYDVAEALPALARTALA